MMDLSANHRVKVRLQTGNTLSVKFTLYVPRRTNLWGSVRIAYPYVRGVAASAVVMWRRSWLFSGRYSIGKSVTLTAESDG